MYQIPHYLIKFIKVFEILPSPLEKRFNLLIPSSIWAPCLVEEAIAKLRLKSGRTFLIKCKNFFNFLLSSVYRGFYSLVNFFVYSSPITILYYIVITILLLLIILFAHESKAYWEIRLFAHFAHCSNISHISHMLAHFKHCSPVAVRQRVSPRVYNCVARWPNFQLKSKKTFANVLDGFEIILKKSAQAICNYQLSFTWNKDLEVIFFVTITEILVALSQNLCLCWTSNVTFLSSCYW
jgi:hypothetical protein